MSAVANLDQRLLALAQANIVRSARADLKQQLRGMTSHEGALFVADLFDAPPAWLASMEAWTLVMTIRRMTPDTARSILRVANVMPKLGGRLSVSDLSARQRSVLAGLLRARGGVA